MNGTGRLDRNEIDVIVQQLHDDGFNRCEAFPIHGWRKRGWPEDSMLYRIVDAKLKYLRLLKEYLPKE